MTDEDKTGSYDSHEEANAPLVLAAIGTVLLVVVGVLTFVVGLLSPFITDGCAAGTEVPAYCRNSQLVSRMLTVPVLVVLPAGLLFTWLRFAPPYRPRAWVPLVGLLIIGGLWVVANSLLGGTLF